MNDKMISRLFLPVFSLLAFALPAAAQDATSGLAGGMKYFLYAVIGFVLLALVLLVYFILQNSKYQKEYNRKYGRTEKIAGLRAWWSYLDKKFFTRAVPVEKEKDVLLDHDYDGIKELDNALPPWWKWGFYFTVIVGVIYLLRFHVFKTGPTPEDEYRREMQVAAVQMEKMKKSGETIDEKTVTMADAAGIDAGKKIFAGTCFPCHGANGEGNAVGPNLTDKYWLHGGTLGNVFKTIVNGVPDKGMQSWGKQFSPTDIKNVASFVLSLQGSNPPNAKAPQGDLFEPGKATDSTAVKKDTTTQTTQ
jgi:cytochrome c oxidase cbb3-type subunit 3